MARHRRTNLFSLAQVLTCHKLGQSGQEHVAKLPRGFPGAVNQMRPRVEGWGREEEKAKAKKADR